MYKLQHVEYPLRLFGGDDCFARMPRELGRLNVRRAVIFCGRTMAASPLLDLVRDAMGDCLAGVFDGVRAHTPRDSVERGAEALSRLGADAVVAVGGGSAVVSARAASIFLAEGYDLDAMCTSRDAQGRLQSPRLNAPKLPQIIIPTTPNTATVKAGSAVFDAAAGERKALFDPKTRAQLIFLHPDFLMSAPVHLVIGSSLDTLTLAVEGLLSPSGDAMADGALMQAMRLLVDTLPRLLKQDNAELRADLTLAAVLGGRGTDYTGAGATTVLGHAIGANHHVENGMVKAAILEHVLRFNAGHAPEGIAKLASAIGLPHSSSDVEDINKVLRSVFQSLELPLSLRELNIPRDDFMVIADRGMKDWFIQDNPRAAGKEDLIGIMNSAW